MHTVDRLIWVPCLFVLVASYSVNDMTSLSTSLLTNYNSNLRPGADQSQTTDIAVNLFFVGLQEFSETTGLFSARLFFMISWTDERLAWTPASHNGVSSMQFSQDSIWTPQLILTNPYSNSKDFGGDKLLLTVTPNGVVRWSTLEVMESTCMVDITKFPYDRQSCAMTFTFLGYSSQQVSFKDWFLSMSNMDKNSLWEISDQAELSRTSTNTRDLLTARFSFSRKSDPYTINIIFPMVAIAFLHITVFFLPADSGERIGFSTTIILSITVYQTIVSDSLPNSTLPSLAYILYKLFADFLISIIVHTLVVVSLSFYLRDDGNPVPEFLAKCTRFPKCKRRNNKLQVQPSVDPINMIKKDSLETDMTSTCNEEVTSDITWKDVGKAWDTIALFISVFAVLVSNSVYFILVT